MDKIIADLNEKKPILIQGAMDSEIRSLLQALDEYTEEDHFGFSFFVGSYQKHPVIVAKTYQGMTNAAASTMLSIEHYTPALIINQGICGGHSPALHRGDILLGKEIINYSNLKIGKSHYKNPLRGCSSIGCEVFSPASPATGAKKVDCFYSHPGLLAIAQACPHPLSQSTVMTGKIASADAWLDRKDLISLMHETFGTCGEDMETASVAQLCHCLNVPLLSMRMLSNTRVHDEEYDENVAETLQEYTMRVVDEILTEALPQSPLS